MFNHIKANIEYIWTCNNVGRRKVSFYCIANRFTSDCLILNCMPTGETYLCVNSLCVYISGETDWKIIAIDVTDPLAKDLNGKIVKKVIKEGISDMILEWIIQTYHETWFVYLTGDISLYTMWIKNGQNVKDNIQTL